MNTNELIGKIQGGELDQDLRRIEEACKHRMKRATANKLEPGAIVKAKNLRPKYICGYLAYLTAPSSQEAMAWHNAVHRGSYQKKCRTEMQYFYPKPWEALKVGPRKPQDPAELEPAPVSEIEMRQELRYEKESEEQLPAIDEPEISDQPAE